MIAVLFRILYTFLLLFFSSILVVDLLNVGLNDFRLSSVDLKVLLVCGSLF